ncbi:hypothetical protein SUGI_0285070 [Cryptomeria japonica]|uniref:uncharacterized protein LOC131060120 n=1 Tax=Cryptomeria japonica TaxID=3369 RepID=UPI00240896E0|nr:uncharacterized protein LOC131060120 [Cryptomeria japonica]GLJ16615.1 hypothetical protein SUGI_0285070 [Cryptomeria japonica]
MAKDGGQKSCLEETFTITSKSCGQNLWVDPSKNDDIVVLSDINNAHTSQQWKKVPKGNLWSFQNVATGGFLCPDNRPSNPDGVRTSLEIQENQMQWKVENWDNALFSWTILDNANRNLVKGLKMVEKHQPVKLLPCKSSQTCCQSFAWEIKGSPI